MTALIHRLIQKRMKLNLELSTLQEELNQELARNDKPKLEWEEILDGLLAINPIFIGEDFIIAYEPDRAQESEFAKAHGFEYSLCCDNYKWAWAESIEHAQELAEIMFAKDIQER